MMRGRRKERSDNEGRGEGEMTGVGWVRERRWGEGGRDEKGRKGREGEMTEGEREGRGTVKPFQS